MAHSSHSNAGQLASILSQLACPACFSSLELNESELVCAGCGRVYPIVDGIPVLISGLKVEGRG